MDFAINTIFNAAIYMLLVGKAIEVFPASGRLFYDLNVEFNFHLKSRGYRLTSHCTVNPKINKAEQIEVTILESPAIFARPAVFYPHLTNGSRYNTL